MYKTGADLAEYTEGDTPVKYRKNAMNKTMMTSQAPFS